MAGREKQRLKSKQAGPNEPLAAMPRRVDVFVSSPTAGNLELRAKLHALGKRLGREIWVAEKSNPALIDEDALSIVGTLVEMVRISDWFVCLLGSPDHGAPIALGTSDAQVSHFEIELYQAVMMGKPILVLQRTGFRPGERLAALLEILQRALPTFEMRREATDREILDIVEQLLAGWKNALQRWVPVRPGLRSRLVQQFAARRAKVAPANSLAPEIFFLDGVFERRREPPREWFVDELLARSEGAATQQQLTLMWLAIRELMPEPPTERCPPELLKRWNQTLVTWNGAACWYGLHGHLYMGALATLGTLDRTRAAIRAQGGLGLDEATIREPSGAFASATYSLARLMPTARGRAHYADLALRHAEAEAAKLGRPDGGLLSVRGSIQLLRGNLEAAEADFTRAVRRLEEESVHPAAHALALADLGGLHLFQPGRAARGRALLHRAIRVAEESGDTGTIIRIHRRLAGAYLWRNPPRAVAHALEANRLAQLAQMFDQVRWWPSRR